MDKTYEKPTVTRFGTMRELTRSSTGTAFNDGALGGDGRIDPVHFGSTR